MTLCPKVQLQNNVQYTSKDAENHLQTCELKQAGYCIELYVGFLHVLDHICTLEIKLLLQLKNLSKKLLFKKMTKDEVVHNKTSFNVSLKLCHGLVYS